MHLKEVDTNLIVVLDALLIDASVTKAAERLGRSPSAVSHALANLREIFDDPLFVRAGQRLVATARAEQLAPTVHIIVSGIESLLRSSAPFDPGTQERSFTIACSDICELGLLHRLREAIRDVAPNILINRRALSGADTLEDLRQAKAQFMVLQGAALDDATDFMWQKLDDEAFVSVARPDHPLAGGKVSKRDFARHEHVLVIPEESGADPVGDHFERHDIQPGSVTAASSAFVALFLALGSDAIATVPESVVHAAAPRDKVARIRQPFAPLVIENHLGWHRSQDRTNATNGCASRSVRPCLRARSRPGARIRLNRSSSAGPGLECHMLFYCAIGQMNLG